MGTDSDLNNNTQICSGDGSGGFDNCHSDSINSEKFDIVTGYAVMILLQLRISALTKFV